MTYLASIDTLEKYRITFTTRVGASAVGETLVASAVATYLTFDVTDVVSTSVNLTGNEIMDLTSVIGKVFNDRDADGYQDDARVTGLKVFGGVDSSLIIPGTVEMNKGDGFTKVLGQASKGLKLGQLKGRNSRNDLSSGTYVQVRAKVKEAIYEDMTITTSEGSVIYIDKAGTVKESHKGLRRKGMTTQDLLVSRSFDEAEDGLYFNIVINNIGVVEEGIPGVRVVGVDGLVHETDAFGRFHVADIQLQHNRGQNYILKVDSATLPRGSVFTTENPKVLRLTGGLFTKFDFGVQLPQQADLEMYKTVKVKDIYFDTAKSKLRRSEKDKVNEINRYLAEYPLDEQKGRVKIFGFADVRGAKDYNQKLSEERAKSVMDVISNVVPELSFNIGVNNSKPHEQDVIEFTAVVNNAGTSDVTDLVIDIPLASQLEIAGKEKSTNGTYDGQRWYINKLEGRSSATVKFKAKVKAFTSDDNFVVPITSFIYSGLTQPFKVNAVKVEGRIKNELDLNINTSTNVKTINELDKFTVRVLVENKGPAAATNLRLKLAISDNIIVHSAEMNLGEFTKNMWSLNSLRSGESTALVLTVSSISGAATQNLDLKVVNVRLDQVDTNDSNEVKSVSVYTNNNIDLVVDSKFSKVSTFEGDNLVYNIIVTNRGPIRASNININYVLPKELKVLEITTDSGKLNSSDWIIPKLEANGSKTLKVKVQPLARTSGRQIKADITKVTQDQIDLNTTNDTYHSELYIKNEADLVLIKKVSNENPVEAEVVTLTWVLKNNGPAVAQNIKVQDNLSNGLVSISEAETTLGRFSNNIWSMDELASGQAVELTRKVKVAEGFAGLQIVDSVESHQFDQKDPKENSVESIEVNVKNNTNLKVTKQFNVSQANEQQDVQSTIEIENMGPAMATHIVIRDAEVLGLRFRDNIRFSQGEFDGLIWKIDSLRVGEKATLSWSHKVEVGFGGQTLTDAIDEVKADQDIEAGSVQNTNPSLKVNNDSKVYFEVRSSVKSVTLGEEFDLSFSVSNKGPAQAKQIVGAVINDSCLDVVRAKTTRGKFIKESSEWHISSVDKDSTEVLVLTLVAKYDCSSESTKTIFEERSMLQDNLIKLKPEPIELEINNLTDLNIKTSISDTVLDEGQTVDLKIKVTNNGTAFVKSANLEFEVSDTFRVLNVTSSKGLISSDKWYLKDLAKGEFAVLNISATVKPYSSSKFAFIKVTSSSLDKKDINTSEDNLKTQILISKNVDLVVNASSSLLEDPANNQVQYVYELTNKGPSVATQIEFLPVLGLENFKPEIFDYTTNTYLDGQRWKIQSLSPLETVRFIIRGRVLNTNKKLQKMNYKILRLDQSDSNITPDSIIDRLGERNERLKKVK